MEADLFNAEGGVAQLSSGLNADKYVVHGVAIGEDDVTLGKSRNVKRWTKDALKDASDSLKGKPLVRDHINDRVDAVIGKVTDTQYKDGTGVIFQAEMTDESLAEKVHNKWLQVSPRIKHPKGIESNDNDETVIDKIYEFVNLALVPDGAAGSNYIEGGNSPDMTQEELAREFDYEIEELASYSTVSYDGLKSGSLDESEIPNDDYKSHYLFPADTKSESSYPLVDADGYLRRGNVQSAWRLRGRAPADISDYLIELSNKFDDPPIDTEDEENASEVEPDVEQEELEDSSQGVDEVSETNEGNTPSNESEAEDEPPVPSNGGGNEEAVTVEKKLDGLDILNEDGFDEFVELGRVNEEENNLNISIYEF